jgi:hypothetical protein
MTNTMTRIGNTHNFSISALQNGTSYNYYVRCIDSLSNVNSNDFVISFTIASFVGTAPNISGIAVSSLSESSATIVWTTTLGATSRVEYGTTAAYESTSNIDSNLKTSHTVVLTGLTPGTSYNFRVHSVGGDSLSAVSQNFVFITASPPAPNNNGNGGGGGGGGGGGRPPTRTTTSPNSSAPLDTVILRADIEANRPALLLPPGDFAMKAILLSDAISTRYSRNVTIRKLNSPSVPDPGVPVYRYFSIDASIRNTTVIAIG